MIETSIPQTTSSFSDYIAFCRQTISQRRYDLKTNPPNANLIIDTNSPFEFEPSPSKWGTTYPCGALLIHGLFDSPFTLKEIGLLLKKNHIPNKAILLPGHGTHPSDLCHVSAQDWIKAVKYGVDALQKETDKVFLIGYSAGAVLSIYHSLQNKHIAGIILIAPAIKIKAPTDMLAALQRLKKWTSKKKEWLFLADEIDYAKYSSIAFNPVLQLVTLTKEISQLHRQSPLSCPVMMVNTDADETISGKVATHFFCSLKNKRNQLILYSTKKTPLAKDPRILYRSAIYTDLNIKHFSHVSLPFSSSNYHYGIDGDFIHAPKRHHPFVYGAYHRLEVKLYDLLYHFKLMKYQRRGLTYNPDFDFMSQRIIEFIKSQ